MEVINKKHIITLAGDIASGKGSVAEILNQQLGYTIYSNGQYFRKLALEHNMSVREFNIYVENHTDIDLQIEKNAKEYADTHNNIVIDARLGWYVVPDSFKIYLKVDLNESARRVLNDFRGKVEQYDNFEQAKKEIAERYSLENERYYKVYKIRKDDLSNYDLIIDTTNVAPRKVADEIIQKYNEWLKNS